MTYDEAKRLKDLIREFATGKPWFHGIGIGRDMKNNSFGVRLYSDRQDIELPAHLKHKDTKIILAFRPEIRMEDRP